jgi:tetratricopeptide (TPR) repeat protein
MNPRAKDPAQVPPLFVDRFLGMRGARLLSVVATVGLAWVMAPGYVLVAGILGWIGQPVALALLMTRSFKAGEFRRALFLTECAERGAWTREPRLAHRINRVGCLVALGRPAEAKELLAEVNAAEVSPRLRGLLAINTAATHNRLGEPQQALDALKATPATEVLGRTQHRYHWNHALALIQMEEFKQASEAAEAAEALRPDPEWRAACRSLRAQAALEERQDLETAQQLSDAAVEALEGRTPVQWGEMFVTRARIHFARTKDVKGTLEILDSVAAQEPRMTLVAQVERKVLLARCHDRAGDTTQARGCRTAALTLCTAENPRLARLKKELGEALQGV